MLRDELSIHARPLAQLALIGGQRGQGKKVAQAGGVFRNHCLVEVGAGSGNIVALLVRCAPQHALFIEARLRCHIRLDADNGLDTGAGHAAVEGIGAVHIAVVGHAYGRHFLADHLVCQHIDLGHAVQHGKLGVVVQVDEGGVFGHAAHHSGAVKMGYYFVMLYTLAAYIMWGFSPRSSLSCCRHRL